MAVKKGCLKGMSVLSFHKLSVWWSHREKMFIPGGVFPLGVELQDTVLYPDKRNVFPTGLQTTLTYLNFGIQGRN